MNSIGIDLGTTNSVISEYRRGKTSIIEVEGQKIVPSVIYFDGAQKQVGHRAKNRLLINPDQCLSSTKRHIGSTWSKQIDGRSYTPVDAAQFILEHLKSQQPDLREVVITVPAYFEEEQRRQTKEAAERAGLRVLRLIPEPTAAAIRYGFDKEMDQLILVVDLGGGTFDVSLLEVSSNQFTVKAVDGNHQLGGDDFDLAIVSYVNDWVLNHNDQDVRNNGIIQQKLKEEAERVKIALASAREETFFLNDPGLSQGVEINITRDEFQRLIQLYLDEIVRKTQNVLDVSGSSIDDINRVVLVGGSCKHPLVQETIKNNFKTPFISDNMDTAVAEGAALVCASLQSLVESSSDFQDVIPHSLGVVFRDETLGFGSDKLLSLKILKKNEPYPAKAVRLGFPVKLDQQIVILKAVRGEADNPARNEILGEVKVPLPESCIGKVLTPIGVIFELDDDGILILTGVQMPPDLSNRSDIEVLFNLADQNKGLLGYEAIAGIITKHDFMTKSLRIQTT